jgi:cytochrome c peroxidase
VTQALGEALIYDQSLSVNKNLACASCHVDYSGFTGASSFFNGTTSAAPGSVPIANADGKVTYQDVYRIGGFTNFCFSVISLKNGSSVGIFTQRHNDAD